MAFEKRLELLKKEMKPSRTFVILTKDKVFSHIENAQERKRMSFVQRLLLPFLKQASTFAFAFIFASALLNVVFLATLQSTKADYIGEVTSSQGKVYIVRSSEKIEVTKTQKLFEGDTIEVEGESNAQLYFYNTGETKLSENTKLKIGKVERQENQENVIALNLEKGSLEGKIDPVGDQGNSSTKLSVVTTSGTVEARNNAAFAVSLNDNGTIASVSASSEQVDLIATNTANPSDAQTVTVTAGQTFTTPVITAVVTDADTQSGATIIASADAGNANVNKPEGDVTEEKKILPIAIRPVQTASGAQIVVQENSNTLVPLPETSIDVYQLGQIQDLDAAVDIAQVKLNNAITAVNAKDEVLALTSIQSYLSTLERIDGLVAAIKQTQTSAKFRIKTLADFINTTALTTINGKYVTAENTINTENMRVYNTSMKKLHYLARIEASFKSRLQLVNSALIKNK
ncbi:MAG: hypothetical protein ACK4NC_06145 [Candidatus Gracilibacteria bacterium]